MTLYDRFYSTFIYEERYRYFIDGLKMTLLLTLASFILGCLVGIGFCALKKSRHSILRKIANVVTNFFVQLPTMVLLMVFVYIIFGSSGLSLILIVIFALTIKAGAFLSEIFFSAIETVNVGEIEAARTLGMSKRQAFFHVILPQSVTAAMPVFKNQFISTLQETSVVGYLAVMDLTRASSIVTSRTLDALFGLIVVSIIYLVIGYVGQVLLSLLDKRTHIGGVKQ